MDSPGRRLREIREGLGLTVRDVETASARIAERNGRREFHIPISRLWDIENGGVVPSIHRLHCLAIIYGRSFSELLALYGIDVTEVGVGARAVNPGKDETSPVKSGLPARGRDEAEPLETAHLGKARGEWFLLPFSQLARQANSGWSFGFIGNDDFTMYPMLMPGSFVAIDESKRRISRRWWRSEYERPIYFFELRRGFACGWCSMEDDSLTIQPHPLSPARARTFRHPQEIEIIGQVVAIAMQLVRRRGPGGLAPTRLLD